MRILKLTFISLAAISLSHALAPAVSAEAPEGESRPTVTPSRNDSRDGSEDAVIYGVPLRLEHRGMLRFRPELIAGGRLGAGLGGVPAPIEAMTGDVSDATTLSWASLRLRYRPLLHIGSNIAISLGIDAPDNLVLGSTHENAGGVLSTPLSLSALSGAGDSQSPPSAGSNGMRDGIRIREAALRVRLFDFLDLELGRGIDHFGLGIFRNNGAGLDANYGSVLDRIAVGFSLAGFRIEGAFEFTASGATTQDVASQLNGAGGQPKDLGMDDDVVTWSLRAGRFPSNDADRAARQIVLQEQRDWAVDWALFTAITSQRFSSSEPLTENSIECAPVAAMADGRPLQPHDCVRLFRRDAFLLRPGAWLRAEYQPDPETQIRTELEVQGIFGDVAHVQRFFDDEIDDSRIFQGIGAASETEVWRGGLGFGLDAGLATGDNGRYLGYLDGQNVLDPDDAAFASNESLRANRRITSFQFNRDYRLDLILFRQVLGGVTNAVYAKPWVAYDVLKTESMHLRVRFDALYAAAMRPSGTPGGGEHWGLEFDGRVELGFASGLEVQLAAGLLVPLNAFQDVLTGALPDPVYALRAITSWRF